MFRNNTLYDSERIMKDFVTSSKAEGQRYRAARQTARVLKAIATKNGRRTTRPNVELTRTGEQNVIPGCERDDQRGPAQLSLW